VRSLSHVLNAVRQGDPSVHSLLVDGERWCREGWVCEGTYWYGDVLLIVAFNRVVNCCTTPGTKAERNLAPFVTDSNVLLRFSADRD
jgi:hypothetical protein